MQISDKQINLEIRPGEEIVVSHSTWMKGGVRVTLRVIQGKIQIDSEAYLNSWDEEKKPIGGMISDKSICTALMGAGIETIGELCKKTADELDGILEAAELSSKKVSACLREIVSGLEARELSLTVCEIEDLRQS